MGPNFNLKSPKTYDTPTPKALISVELEPGPQNLDICNKGALKSSFGRRAKSVKGVNFTTGGSKKYTITRRSESPNGQERSASGANYCSVLSWNLLGPAGLKFEAQGLWLRYLGTQIIPPGGIFRSYPTENRCQTAQIGRSARISCW